MISETVDKASPPSRFEGSKVESETSGKANLARTIGRNTIFGVVARATQVATRLVTIPIVVSHLGLDGYGIWSIIMTASAYMRFGSVGIKSAFQKYVAEATGTGDFDKANRLLSTGSAALLVLSVSALIPIALFSTALAKAGRVPPTFLHSTSGAISVLAVIMVMSNVGSVYEAIVMGGHRIDLARNFSTFFTVVEAIAIVILLHFGLGLFAMASVMAISELGFVLCCYVAAKRVLPQIRLGLRFVTKSVTRELVRFAGSYQFVNVLEVLYGAILPVTILRAFGAYSSGVYAVTMRLVTSAGMLPDALLLPILSGAAMVFASGTADEMRLLIIKAFKVTLGLSIFPLAFIALFGPTMLMVWIGQVDASFRVALWLGCLAGFFQAFSLLGLVLYRASGNALLDNLRQVLRIVVLLVISLFARRLGFYGVLGGLALAELVGMLFMLFAVTKTFQSFHPRALVPNAIRLTAASGAVLLVAALATKIPLPAISSARALAALALGKVFFACLLAAWPALILTKSLTIGEGKALAGIFLPKRISRARPYAPTAGQET